MFLPLPYNVRRCAGQLLEAEGKYQSAEVDQLMQRLSMGPECTLLPEASCVNKPHTRYTHSCAWVTGLSHMWFHSSANQVFCLQHM